MRRLTFPALTAMAVLGSLPTTVHAQGAQRFAPSGRGTSAIELVLPDGTPDSVKAPAIRVDHGQPHLRGRALHQDTTFVPYDRVWRTGANATSTFETDLPLRFGGAILPKGRYALFTLPSRSGWKLILQRDVGQTIADYDAKNDVVRVDMRRRELHTPVESLSMWLVPSTAAGTLGGELRIVWGTSELAADFTVAP